MTTTANRTRTRTRTRPETAVSPTTAARPEPVGPAPFPRIESYAFLSGCHTGALVAPDGSVEWLCIPSLLRKTVDAVADELTESGFVLRYRTDETDDGMSGKEGTFLICSFWLVSALAIVGEMPQARDLMERLLRVASPLGLYAEEFEAETGRHLGNFPQAFSHLAMIEAAARIILAERLEELR